MRSPRMTHLTRRSAGVALATCSLLAASTVFAGPSSSAPDPGCPASADPGSLADGAPVHGLTTTKGTSPGGFTGTFQGVLQDWIAPGVDLILVDLHSPTIDKVGVWEGMSGSPVYDAQGDLLGAVSYGLGYGPSTIAGVTPAAEMRALLDGGGPAAASARHQGRLPASLATGLVRRGVTSSASSGQVMRQLPLPFTVSGLLPARLPQVSRRLGLGQAMSGSPGGTAAASIPVVAGGNMAASLSYGTVTSSALGTATLVCGSQVVGFGHPFDFTGPTNLTLHGASTVLIQDDSTGSGFNVANLGAPVGTVDNDRLAGIHAVTGPPPTSALVTSSATDGARSITASTHVTARGVLPDVGQFNMLAAQDRILDRIGGGTIEAAWTVRGTGPGGTPFRQKHRDVYRDTQDVSFATTDALWLFLYRDLRRHLAVESVSTTSQINDSTAILRVTGVQRKVSGSWVGLRPDRAASLRAGAVARLRILLRSTDGTRQVEPVQLQVPLRAAHHSGVLRLVSGGDGVRGLQHDQVRATLRYPGAPGTASRARSATVTLHRVVKDQLTRPLTAH